MKHFSKLYRNNGKTNCNLKLIIDEENNDGKSKIYNILFNA